MRQQEPDIAELTRQILRDPALAGSNELIPRRPMLDIYGQAFRFGSLERSAHDPKRIVAVRLVRVGAPEQVHTLDTDSEDLPRALGDALSQLVERFRK